MNKITHWNQRIIIRLIFIFLMIAVALVIQSKEVLATDPVSTSFDVIHYFGASSGRVNAPFITGTDGDYYGIDSEGGRNLQGAFFKVVRATGQVIVLADFSLNNGMNPVGIVSGTDGFFYGVSKGGGTAGLGTFWKVTTAGILTKLADIPSSPVDTVYYSHPQGILLGQDGNFYINSENSIFRATAGGSLTLFARNGFPSGYALIDYRNMVQAGDGTLYGTSERNTGGSFNTVLWKAPTTGGTNMVSVVKVMDASTGSYPVALTTGLDGNVYGVNTNGGGFSFGTFWRCITTTGSLSVLADFGSSSEIVYPSSLTTGTDGNFYGGAYGGVSSLFKAVVSGSSATLTAYGPSGYYFEYLTRIAGNSFVGVAQDNPGLVLEVSATSSRTIATLSPNGWVPFAPFPGLVLAKDGCLYGNTLRNIEMTTDAGALYRVSSGGALEWVSQNPIMNFLTTSIVSTNGKIYEVDTNDSIIRYATNGDNDIPSNDSPGSPSSGSPWGEMSGGSYSNLNYIIQAKDGNFYGTLMRGGTANWGESAYGTFFKLSKTGSLTRLVDFPYADPTTATAPTGAFPVGITQGDDGNFYGVCYSLSQENNPDFPGSVFKVTPGGVLTNLAQFPSLGGPLNTNATGGHPCAPIVKGLDGNFYGTCRDGGAYGYGTVFQIVVSGSVATVNKIADFDYTNGANPVASLITGTDGTLYGTATGGGDDGFGTVFKITVAGATGTLTRLISFTGEDGLTPGSYPTSNLTWGSDGNLYGTTSGDTITLNPYYEFPINTNLNEQSSTVNGGTVFRIQFKSVESTPESKNTGSSTVTLVGSANPAGVNTSAWFEYGLDTNYGNQTQGEFLGSGASPVYLSAQLNDLSASTTYHYRLASFINGTVTYGIDQTFRTTSFDAQQLLLKGDIPPNLPTGVTFSNFGNPAINNNGDVAFLATISGMVVSATETHGIWVGISNYWNGSNSYSYNLVIRSGTNAPGTVGAVFLSLSDPVFNDNDAVAFIGTLKTGIGDAVSSPVSNSKGVWSNDSGSLKLVARLGTQAPGCPAGATFSAINQLVLPNQGGVILLGTLHTGNTTSPDPGGITTANNIGIWAVDTDGNLQLIVRKGDLKVINGINKTITGLSFLPLPASLSSQSRGFSQTTGDLIYKATFNDRSTGIFLVRFP